MFEIFVFGVFCGNTKLHFCHFVNLIKNVIIIKNIRMQEVVKLILTLHGGVQGYLYLEQVSVVIFRLTNTVNKYVLIFILQNMELCKIL